MFFRSGSLVMALVAVVQLLAQDLPQLSPTATVTQRIGLVDVTVTYSRPSAKGRRVFGDLVPYGEVWRTGANHCTVIETSGPLTIAGKELPGGKFALFTVPNQGAWEVIINRNADLSGTEGYDPAIDVIRTKVPVRACNFTETFVMLFENFGVDRADLVLRWANEEVALDVVADATKQAMLNITEALNKPDADFVAYARSAAFYLDRRIDPAKALEWAEKSVGMQKKYWNTFYLARALAANGQYKAAVTKGNEAAELALAGKDAGTAKTYQAQVAEWEALSKGK